MENDNPIYSRKEVNRILRKAAELQADREAGGPEEGLTETELLHVAREAGIDLEVMHRAMQEFDRPESADRFSWLKGTSTLQEKVRLQGEIPEEQWEELIQEIREITGEIGKTGQTGSSFEWELRKGNLGSTHISATPRKGATTFRYASNWGHLKFMIHMVAFMIGFTTTAIALDGSNFSDFLSLLLAILGGGVLLPFGRLLLKSIFDKRKQQMQRLFAAFANRMRSSGGDARRITADLETESPEQEQAGSGSSASTRVRSQSSLAHGS